VAKYGFKISKIKATMIRQLELCWAALNPLGTIDTTKKTKKPAGTSGTKVKRVRKSKTPDLAESEEVSSDEVPLADLEIETTATKGKKKKAVKPPPMTLEQLYTAFRKMMVDDTSIYMKILRYEVSHKSMDSNDSFQLIVPNSSHYILTIL
jgi:hypothetical protein